MVGGNKLNGIYSEIDTLSQWINKHEKLIESHMNDFIVSNLKVLLPRSEDIVLQYEKTCEDFGKINCCIDSKYGICHEFCLHDNDPEESDEKKHNTFLSIKKNHEIVAMSLKVSTLCKQIKCINVVDVGSGKGYLGQRLSDDYNLNVLGIEGCHDYSLSAINRQQTFEKIKTKNYSACNFRTINYEIDKESVKNSNDFITRIKENMKDMNSSDGNNAILIGLHACGDLTTDSLKMFTLESYFKAILIVGCCYNLCTETGFPLSAYVKAKDLIFGKNAFMLACQSPVKWKHTNQELGHSLLFRSIFQKLVSDKDIDENILKSIKFRKIGKKAKTFQDYISLASKNLPSDVSEVLITEAEEYFSNYKDLWSEMKQFHWLRMQLAPCIEKLILLDRICYLMEIGYQNASVVKLFETTLSPRCLAIICNKND